MSQTRFIMKMCIIIFLRITQYNIKYSQQARMNIRICTEILPL